MPLVPTSCAHQKDAQVQGLGLTSLFRFYARRWIIGIPRKSTFQALEVATFLTTENRTLPRVFLVSAIRVGNEFTLAHLCLEFHLSGMVVENYRRQRRQWMKGLLVFGQETIRYPVCDSLGGCHHSYRSLPVERGA